MSAFGLVSDGTANQSKKRDLRVERTNRALVGALRTLLAQKGIDEISVTEICRLAEVRTATFYTHFRCKEELFCYLIEGLQQEHASAEGTRLRGSSEAEYCASVFGFILSFLEANPELSGKVMRSSSRNLALDVLEEETFRDLCTRYQDEEGSSPLSELGAAARAGAIISSARWWLSQSPHPPKDETIAMFRMQLEGADGRKLTSA